ncbi:hypothetical protein EV426DRAFT_584212 [Tirmania nivea]|nr:hypothetical protein EV426DRAFT_584212 [Tirmania nivea]
MAYIFLIIFLISVVMYLSPYRITMEYRIDWPFHGLALGKCNIRFPTRKAAAFITSLASPPLAKTILLHSHPIVL